MTFRFALVTLVAAGSCCVAQTQTSAGEPLTIRSQGSFFVGGEKKALPAPPGSGAVVGREITVNRM